MPQDRQKVSGSQTIAGSTSGISTQAGLARVLVAATDDGAREARGRQLHASGLRVLFARTGFEAIVKASCHLPSLILLDASLGQPEIDEISRLLATCPVTAHIPIVRLTARRNMPRRMLQQIAATAP
jgi:CheY-like chemotaxis protein